MLELDGRQMQLLQLRLRSANHAICHYDIYHTSNENTDKYKNQRAAFALVRSIFMIIANLICRTEPNKKD